MMNEKRERLLTRMIRIYGFEHEEVLNFARLCETEDDEEVLAWIVDVHETCPIIDEDEDNE